MGALKKAGPQLPTRIISVGGGGVGGGDLRGDCRKGKLKKNRKKKGDRQRPDAGGDVLMNQKNKACSRTANKFKEVMTRF